MSGPGAPATSDGAGSEDICIMDRYDHGVTQEALAESDGSELEACASAHGGAAMLALISGIRKSFNSSSAHSDMCGLGSGSRRPQLSMRS